MEEWQSKIDDDTRFVYMEAPSDPQQSFCDVKALADLAHSWKHPGHLRLDVRDTGPDAAVRPRVDIVVHSLTKSITFGGLAVGGALISRKPIVTASATTIPASRSCTDYPPVLAHAQGTPTSPHSFSTGITLNDLRPFS